MIRTLINEFCQCGTAWEGDIKLEHGQPVLIKRDGGPLRLWLNLREENKVSFSKYAAGADIGQGTGATPSCVSVVDTITGEKVAEYASPFIKPTDFAMVCYAIVQLFHEAFFVWESSGAVGEAFGEPFLATGYRNIYYNTTEMPVQMSKVVSDKPGWKSTGTSKETMLVKYAVALEARRFINHSKEALEETLNFRFSDTGQVEHANIKNKNDPSGARVNHSDRAIADGLAWLGCLEVGLGVAAKPEVEPEVDEQSFAGRRKLRRQLERERSWR